MLWAEWVQNTLHDPLCSVLAWVICKKWELHCLKGKKQPLVFIFLAKIFVNIVVKIVVKIGCQDCCQLLSCYQDFCQDCYCFRSPLLQILLHMSPLKNHLFSDDIFSNYCQTLSFLVSWINSTQPKFCQIFVTTLSNIFPFLFPRDVSFRSQRLIQPKFY